MCVLCVHRAISRPQLVTGTLQSYFPTCLFPDGKDESSGLLFKNDGWRMGEGEREREREVEERGKVEEHKAERTSERGRVKQRGG